MAKENAGRKNHQKLKTYLIMEYLQRHTDETHAINADSLAAELGERYGIDAERRSIYSDIKEINTVLLMLENDCTIEEAEEMLADMPNDEKPIAYNTMLNGFWMQHRRFAPEDVRLLAECVYSFRFLDEKRANLFVDEICRLVSTGQEKTIKHCVVLTDRVKTENRDVLATLSTITEALEGDKDAKRRQIQFGYLHYKITDMKQHISTAGKTYTVSPYEIIIDGGNYYLRAFDGKAFRTFRIDRMTKAKVVEKEAEGQQQFKKTDLTKVFSMYEGKSERVSLICISPLLDTMVDKFGKKNAVYNKIDERHFRVTAEVEVSPQFFGWLCGFGNRVYVETKNVAEAYLQYLDKIENHYRKEE